MSSDRAGADLKQTVKNRQGRVDWIAGITIGLLFAMLAAWWFAATLNSPRLIQSFWTFGVTAALFALFVLGVVGALPPAAFAPLRWWRWLRSQPPVQPSTAIEDARWRAAKFLFVCVGAFTIVATSWAMSESRAAFQGEYAARSAAATLQFQQCVLDGAPQSACATRVSAQSGRFSEIERDYAHTFATETFVLALVALAAATIGSSRWLHSVDAPLRLDGEISTTRSSYAIFSGSVLSLAFAVGFFGLSVVIQ